MLAAIGMPHGGASLSQADPESSGSDPVEGLEPAGDTACRSSPRGLPVPWVPVGRSPEVPQSPMWPSFQALQTLQVVAECVFLVVARTLPAR